MITFPFYRIAVLTDVPEQYTILSDTDKKVRKEYGVAGGLFGLVDGE